MERAGLQESSWANCLPRFTHAFQGWTLLPRASSRGTLLSGQLNGSASFFSWDF